MSRWLKITLKISAAFVLIILVAWLGAAFYISRNNKAILETILHQLNANVNGKIEVGSMETTLLQGFPGVAVSLKKVALKDSLWAAHHHQLLDAADIGVSLNIFSLIIGNIKINKIAINNANIYLYTDSAGYSNTSMFKTKKAGKAKTSTDQAFEINRIDFNKVDLILNNERRFKLFHFSIDELKGKIAYPDSGWHAQLKLKTLVKDFAFNTKKGSFLKDNILQGTLIAHYNNKNKTITIEQKPLQIGKNEFHIGAEINLAKKESAFAIAIRADEISYKDLSLLLAPNISVKLLRFAIEKPIGVVGSIVDDGNKKYKDPLINVRMNVKNNAVTIPSGQLNNCSFTGTFTNRDTLNRPIGDENSAIKFYALSADYYNAPLKVDTFTITNLNRPLAAGFVTAQFPLERLNSSIGGNTFHFKKGTAAIRLYCKTSIDNFRFTKPVLSGNVVIKNADITYLPRNLNLVNSELLFNFNQKDLTITNSRFQLGKSILRMNCSIQNFLNFYYTDPSKILVNLNMNSPQLNLGEFMGFLAQRRTIKKTSSSGNTVKEVADQLNTVLEASTVKIQLNVNQAIYKKFIAANLSANISLLRDGIYLNKINISHAGGNLNLSGSIKQAGPINKFAIKSTISKVNVKDFFYAFDNFGQETITNQNLKGYLSAKVDASGSINDKGHVISRAMYGQVIFNLHNAALIDFEPLQKVQKLAFANRDFTHIKIENLDGTFTLMGDKIAISPMQVNTSVLNFNMTGIYGLSNGTAIAMDIPLRNPKKDENITKEEKKLVRMKGIVLHLIAVEEAGKLKIKWNRDHD